MSFDWSEYLHLARRLTEYRGSPMAEEASLRSAVSRAYYAAYRRAQNWLCDKEGYLAPKGPKAHKEVRDRFRKSRDAVRSEIGEDLDRLRMLRNKADYDDAVPDLPKKAQRSLILAEGVLAKLATL